MSEYIRPKSEQEFADNFAQIKPLMNNTEAYYESSRCLFCYDAPCVNACPSGIDIPLFIRQINTNDTIGSAKTIYNSNYFGYACGKVCPTEVLCEGACVYNHQGVKPIEIGRLQSFATQKAMVTNKQLFNIAPKNGKKIAIIGAGAAGISAACELQLHGFEAVIFESKSKPSGLTIYGVAPYKITNQEAIDEMDYLQKQFGFTINYNQTIQTKQDINNLENNFDAILIGIGLGNTAALELANENAKNCFGAVEFIEQLRNEHHNIHIPDKIVVIGGGNTAMDAASECARMGAQTVILAYRRNKTAMGAYHFEYDLAKAVGVKGLFNVQPIAIETKNNTVTGVKFIRTHEVQGKLQTIENSEFIEPCDWVIKATGQSKQLNFLSLINNLQLNNKGCVNINSATCQTTNPRYFAAGDCVNGGKEVVNATAEGKLAAKGIIQYLQG